MADKKVIFISEKDVGISYISTLLRKLAFIFQLEGRSIKNYHFLISAKELHPVSALVLYKFFEYQLRHECLEEPSANLDQLLDLVSKYRLEKLFKNLIDKRDAESLFKHLKPYQKDGFFIAPHPINRDSFKSKEDLERKYTDFITDYYDKICPGLVQYFKTCICEIASNFLYHALEDENSILMAQGSKRFIEIVCVDNSKGIISSLNPDSSDAAQVMEEAFMKGKSSKKGQGHCGTGLWYIEQITKNLNGTFKVYSEGISYFCKGNRIFIRESPYWHGSIFYLKLPVTDHKQIDDFFKSYVKNSDLGLVNN